MGRSSQEEIARRLEEVREWRGFDSLVAFHEDLVERTEQSFSYTALRNYHDPGEKGRVPPVGYLYAVSQAFDVRLPWLVADDGPMTATGIDPDALETKILHGLGLGATSAAYPWADPLSEVTGRFKKSGKVEFPLDEARDVTGEVAQALRGPLDALGIAPERMGWDALNDYIVSMIPVLLTLAPEYERQRPVSRDQEDDA